MAHLFIKSAQSEWLSRDISGKAVALADLIATEESNRSPAGAIAGLIGNFARPEASSFMSVLMLPLGVHARVNGRHFMGGIKCLEDRDEIVIGEQRFYFSTERMATVEQYAAPSAGPAIFCPRCKQGIEDGCAIVACPQCGAKHHQSEENDLPCWTYADQCSLCDCRTDLQEDFRWNPTTL